MRHLLLKVVQLLPARVAPKGNTFGKSTSCLCVNCCRRLPGPWSVVGGPSRSHLGGDMASGACQQAQRWSWCWLLPPLAQARMRRPSQRCTGKLGCRGHPGAQRLSMRHRFGSLRCQTREACWKHRHMRRLCRSISYGRFEHSRILGDYAPGTYRSTHVETYTNQARHV